MKNLFNLLNMYTWYMYLCYLKGFEFQNVIFT